MACLLVAGSIYGFALNKSREQKVDDSLKSGKLQTQISQYFASRHITYGVYYEDLLSHRSFSAAAPGATVFLAASLLKLPYVMDTYKAAELGRVDLARSYDIEPDMRDSRFGDLWKPENTSVSLQDAAALALVKSDNTALRFIKKYAEPQLDESDKVMPRLDIHPVVTDTSYIDAKSYSRFFRCLAEACFNSRSDSDTILDSLSRTDFPGIVSGVPEGIKVAHKVGISSESHSDCGIIYAPNHPYILCIMVDQPRPDYLSSMKDVSKMVYTQASSLN